MPHIRDAWPYIQESAQRAQHALNRSTRSASYQKRKHSPFFSRDITLYVRMQRLAHGTTAHVVRCARTALSRVFIYPS